jgi:transposase-like protein
MPARRPIDDLLAVRLAGGSSFKDAAAELGVDERTARRRWANPAFRAKVAQLRREMTDRAVGRLADALVEAADELRRLIGSNNESTRLRAAIALLNHATQTVLLADVQARLNALEESLNHAGFAQSLG